MYIYIILYNIFNVYTIFIIYILYSICNPFTQVLYHSFISGFGAQRDELTGGGGSTGGGMWDAQIHGRRFLADLVWPSPGVLFETNYF